MSEFKLEHGKRYVTRDGRVTDGVVLDMRLAAINRKVWPFIGSIDGNDLTWREDGVYVSKEGGINDLVREYVEPTPPRYEPFTSADYIDHLHNRVIVHPEHERQVIRYGDSRLVHACPACVYIDYADLVDCTYEDTGKPVGREVTA